MRLIRLLSMMFVSMLSVPVVGKNVFLRRLTTEAMMVASLYCAPSLGYCADNSPSDKGDKNLKK